MQRELRRRIVEVHGERGASWLERLPELIARCERRWSFAVEAPFTNLSYNWTAPGTRFDGTSIVLKLGVPSPELTSEIEAMRAWAGNGAALVIDADEAEGALVLERLRPGTTLEAGGPDRDDEAVVVAATLARELHRAPLVATLPSLTAWTDGIPRAKRAGFAPALIERALRVRDELLVSSSKSVLLHADLHHRNVLAAERQPWLAIDPKGVIGDPAFEPAPFLYNPLERVLEAHDARAIVTRRVDGFSEYFDRDRILGWGFVQAVLSGWWSFEDHGHGHEPALRFAELLWQLR